ncbi:MAG: hypothetical protein COB02_18335 [Candidatus Cloacimonadota bacterium]|nr:MAG: hypothetical protein COB02_18335 [Candidatus Cloacimonadota bacterium]
MQEEEIKKLRFIEVKNFLLFHSKVLKNQKSRVVIKDEESANWKVSKNLQYELQKLIDFLNENDVIKDKFQDEIIQYQEIKNIVDDEKNREDIKIAQEVFDKIENIREQIKIKQYQI